MLPKNKVSRVFPDRGSSHAEVNRHIARLCGRDHSYGDGTVFNSISSQPLPLAANVFRRYLATRWATTGYFLACGRRNGE